MSARFRFASLLSALVLASVPAAAEHYRDRPMPEGRGCWIERCVLLFDGYRHGERCYWRCPRRREEREPPSYSREPSTAYRAREDSAPDSAFLLAIALGVVAALALLFSGSSADVENDIAQTKALTDELDAAARKADAHIDAFLKKMASDNEDRHG